MKIADDRAPNTKATPSFRRHAHRPRAAVLVGTLGAALLMLLPNAAQAEHGYGGSRVGTAEISVSPDGYDNGGSIFALFTQKAEVKGRNFGNTAVVEIFLCPKAVATGDVLVRCQPLRTVVADENGSFETGDNDVVYSNYFFSGSGVNFCRGFADWHVQCSIVAATFTFDPSPTVLGFVPTAMAEHLICYEGGAVNNCDPRPTTTVS